MTNSGSGDRPLPAMGFGRRTILAAGAGVAAAALTGVRPSPAACHCRTRCHRRALVRAPGVRLPRRDERRLPGQGPDPPAAELRRPARPVQHRVRVRRRAGPARLPGRPPAGRRAPAPGSSATRCSSPRTTTRSFTDGRLRQAYNVGPYVFYDGSPSPTASSAPTARPTSARSSASSARPSATWPGPAWRWPTSPTAPATRRYLDGAVRIGEWIVANTSIDQPLCAATSSASTAATTPCRSAPPSTTST